MKEGWFAPSNDRGWFVNPADRSVAVPARWRARGMVRAYRDHLVRGPLPGREERPASATSPVPAAQERSERPAMSPLRGLEMVLTAARDAAPTVDRAGKARPVDAESVG